MTETPTTNTTARETLRRVVDLLAAHPDLPPPYLSLYDHRPNEADLKWYLHINDKGDAAVQRETAQTIIRILGGKWDKSYDETAVDFEQKRDGLNLQVTVTREAVCRRVVKGVETVTLPAVVALPERTVEREIVEWECEPVLAEAVSR